MSEKTEHLFSAALDSLQHDIEDSVKHQRNAEGVPCEAGVRAFLREVQLYWLLRDRVQLGKKVYEMAEQQAMCEATPTRGD